MPLYVHPTLKQHVQPGRAHCHSQPQHKLHLPKTILTDLMRSTAAALGFAVLLALVCLTSADVASSKRVLLKMPVPGKASVSVQLTDKPKAAPVVPM